MNIDAYYPYIQAVLRILCVSVFFFLLLVRSPSTYGNVTVTDTGLKVAAEAAEFGRPLSYGLEYMARLQYFPSNPHLCPNSPSNDLFESDHTFLDLTNNNQPSFIRDMYDEDLKTKIIQLQNNSVQKHPAKDTIVVPKDGSPVAILARRGSCSYEEKALAATQLLPGGVVHFVIVYDDRPEAHLIKMSADGKVDNSAIDKIGMTFVSQESGYQLKQDLQWQSRDVQNEGGPRILLSSHSRFFLSFQTTFAKWAAILCLSFVCAASCLCIIGSETGPPDSQVVVNEGTNPGRYRHGLRLLNEDEVKELPEIEYGHAELVDQDLGKKKKTDTKKSETKDEKAKVVNSTTEETDDSTDPESLVKSDMTQSSKSEDLMEGAKVTATVVGPPALRGTTVEYFHSTSCSICIEDYLPGEKIRVLPCGHAFHSECILPWLTDRSPTCPLCKALFEVTREGDVDPPGSSNQSDDNASQHSLRTRTMMALGINPPGMPPPPNENSTSNENEQQQPSSSSSPPERRTFRNRLSQILRRQRRTDIAPNESAQSTDLQQPLLGRNEI